MQEFVKNSRGIEIFTKQWLPAKGEIKGLVFYCHGYGDTCAYFFDGKNGPCITTFSKLLCIDLRRFCTLLAAQMQFQPALDRASTFWHKLLESSVGTCVALLTHPAI